MDKKNQATYLVSENDIMKISALFGQLESAIKERIRNREIAVITHDLNEAEIYFHELTSRTYYECDNDIETKRLDLDKIF